MATSLKTKNIDIAGMMASLGKAARDAAGALANTSATQKNAALTAAAQALRDGRNSILAANQQDMTRAKVAGSTNAFLDRLKLTEDRVEVIAKGLETVAALDDPVGDVIAKWERPNGLNIERVRVPLGVIGIIYESRPNVTADAGALCLKSGNATILRGGSEAAKSNHAILACLQKGLRTANLPEACITLVPTQDRAAVGVMLQTPGLLDVVVPRGGRSLVERVQVEARVPVLAHLDGLNTTYVHKAADIDKARKIVLNAKMRRTGICGATETLLIDRDAADNVVMPIIDDLIAAGCEVRGDRAVSGMDDRVVAATAEDWDTEYLDAIISVGLVDGVDSAIDHIRTHGSSHTDAIITEDAAVANKFLSDVDSAIVMHNTSTQFGDGGEFGMGAEIGIATGKLHARGPVGVEQLTSFKYVVRSDGQTRA